MAQNVVTEIANEYATLRLVEREPADKKHKPRVVPVLNLTAKGQEQALVTWGMYHRETESGYSLMTSPDVTYPEVFDQIDKNTRIYLRTLIFSVGSDVDLWAMHESIGNALIDKHIFIWMKVDDLFRRANSLFE
ncbi:MAG: hypothetical protein ABI716_00180 [Candidatus Saccharibacteria bacterium]